MIPDENRKMVFLHGIKADLMTKEKIKNIKKIFILFLIVIAAVYFLDRIRNNIPAGMKLDKIKMNVGEWKGFNESVSAKSSQWIDKGDLIIRTYFNNKDSIYLVAFQEREDRHKVHSPVDCYTGSGWAILEKGNITIGDKNKDNFKTIRRMQVEKNNNTRIVYYWFSNGVESCASFRGHLLLFLRDVLLKGSIKSWVCFQISTDVRTNYEETEKILKNFISKLSL